MIWAVEFTVFLLRYVLMLLPEVIRVGVLIEVPSIGTRMDFFCKHATGIKVHVHNCPIPNNLPQ